MATVNLNIYTSAYPSITNDIEINLYLQSDDTAVIATVRKAAPHGLHTWSFPGLTPSNYLFRIFEIAGSTIVQQLGDDMDVVPGSAGDVLFRATEQIEAGSTVGFTAGTNTFTFDGTGGTEDWRGWDIDTADRMSIGPMKKNLDYSWNKTTGVFTLLVSGDVFGPLEWFNISFAAQTSDVASSVPVIIPTVTATIVSGSSYTIDATTDFGKTILIDPSGNYAEIQLPDIATVTAGKIISFEMRRASVQKCAKILTMGADVIDWLAGNRSDIFICPNEFISLYKFIDPAGPTSMWRVLNPIGNYATVGRQFNDDNLPVNVFNQILMDGADADVLQFARLYNDYVLQLAGGQAVNYDDWATGNNKYKFSLANSSIGANAGKFKIPDRRNAFDRNTDGTRIPGDYQIEMIGPHAHAERAYTAGGGGTGPNIFVVGFFVKIGSLLDGQAMTANNTGTENRPANYATRKYLLV